MKIVWARKHVSLQECPTSTADGQNVTFIEEFLLRRRMGFGEIRELPARVVDAFAVLQVEMERETRNATQDN